MITLEVDGRKVEAKDGETILSALKREGIQVPTLCHMENLPPSGACRLCVVELEGAPNLVPSCSYPVANGMKLKTRTTKVLDARRTIIELLLGNHPDDCLYCARNGKCDLQTMAQTMGIRQRLYRGKKSTREMDVASPSIVRDPD
jgi:NADH dehydrogenase/NADH:ubiquinone oxidoreductase subunit G